MMWSEGDKVDFQVLYRQWKELGPGPRRRLRREVLKGRSVSKEEALLAVWLARRYNRYYRWQLRLGLPAVLIVAMSWPMVLYGLSPPSAWSYFWSHWGGVGVWIFYSVVIVVAFNVRMFNLQRAVEVNRRLLAGEGSKEQSGQIGPLDPPRGSLTERETS